MQKLLYGFRSNKTFPHNISARIVKSIKPRSGLTKLLLPVRFDEKILRRRLQAQNPTVIIGLGQGGAGKFMKIERRAVNLIKQRRTGLARVIRPSGPMYFYTSGRNRAANGVKISYDAGNYFCNYSMYLVSEWKQNKKARFYFIHVPKNFDVKRAAAYVEKLLARR